VIRLSGISFSYGPGEAILAGLDLTLDPGLTLLLGRNGCGKSTLLKIAAGVEMPDRGRVEIDGHDLWTEEVAARRSLAYVPEQPDLTPYATVREILGLVCRLRGEPRAAVDEALQKVGLADLAHRSVRQLSMGQRRRAVLAAAFLGRPAHVLLDEPLEAMDRGARDDILAWIDRLVAEGATVVAVSHDLEPFAARTSRALTIRDGQCRSVDPLPEAPAERRALLEKMARGDAP
jgi:ABC-type multidrug transport system ATPase subunit